VLVCPVVIANHQSARCRSSQLSSRADRLGRRAFIHPIFLGCCPGYSSFSSVAVVFGLLCMQNVVGVQKLLFIRQGREYRRQTRVFAKCMLATFLRRPSVGHALSIIDSTISLIDCASVQSYRYRALVNTCSPNRSSGPSWSELSFGVRRNHVSALKVKVNPHAMSEYWTRPLLWWKLAHLAEYDVRTEERVGRCYSAEESCENSA
jgi:hypothetical protein